MGHGGLQQWVRSGMVHKLIIAFLWPYSAYLWVTVGYNTVGTVRDGAQINHSFLLKPYLAFLWVSAGSNAVGAVRDGLLYDFISSCKLV